jgi:hypothetical protein
MFNKEEVLIVSSGRFALPTTTAAWRCWGICKLSDHDYRLILFLFSIKFLMIIYYIG